jgi:hypothetical protein
MADVLHALGRHLRRYPGWYPLVAVWAAALALLPVLDTHPAHPTRAAATTAPRAAVTAARAVNGVTAARTTDLAASVAAAATAVEPASNAAGPAGNGNSSPTPPAADNGLHLPQLPPLPLPTPPAALEPALQVASPFGTTACGVLGITRLGADTLAPAVPFVPVEEALAYLIPVFTACAVLPPPVTATRCAIDDQVVANEPSQLDGIYPVPPLVGLSVDALEATGVSGLAAPVAAALDCDVHAGS